MTSSRQYDAIVIGSGQGGNPLAHSLADRDWRVALIERQYLGGSCINYGCTPTKTMIASAQVAHTARTATKFGVNSGPVSIDLPAVIHRKNAIVRQMRMGQQRNIDARPALDLYRGLGSFAAPHTVLVDGTQKLEAPRIFIDTGSGPRIPDIPGLQKTPYYTNLNIMDLANLPHRLLILGGNYLGLEFGQMFRRFGSEVTIVEHGPQIVPREDPDVAQALQEALEAEGIEFYLDAQPTAVTGSDGQVVLTVQTHENNSITLHGSHLLLAVGRVPNTPALNLEVAGIETDDEGYIKVNDRLETSASGVWALGDVKGGPAFTHVSYDDYLIIFDHLFHDGTRTTGDRIIPYALFTDPQLGRVGLSQSSAQEAGYRLKVGSIPMYHVARAREDGKTAGLMKIVINADDDQILGATILGEGGAELVQHIATLMRAKGPYTLLKQAIYIHPTITEGFYTLIEKVGPLDANGAS